MVSFSLFSIYRIKLLSASIQCIHFAHGAGTNESFGLHTILGPPSLYPLLIPGLIQHHANEGELRYRLGDILGWHLSSNLGIVMAFQVLHPDEYECADDKQEGSSTIRLDLRKID